MKQTAIFWPVLALIAWTFLILVQIPIRRFRAAFAGRVTASDFTHGESRNVPTDVALPNRIFMNLVEVPALFYVVCIVCFVTANVNVLLLTLAWLYVALRIVHSIVSADAIATTASVSPSAMARRSTSVTRSVMVSPLGGRWPTHVVNPEVVPRVPITSLCFKSGFVGSVASMICSWMPW